MLLSQLGKRVSHHASIPPTQTPDALQTAFWVCVCGGGCHWALRSPPAGATHAPRNGELNTWTPGPQGPGWLRWRTRRTARLRPSSCSPGAGSALRFRARGSTRSSWNFPGPGAPAVPAPNGHKRGSPISASHRAQTAAPATADSLQIPPPPPPAAESHGPRRAPRRAPRSPAPADRDAAAAAAGGRQPARSRGARAHRAALPVSADRAGHSPQEHPERESDVAGPALRPDRSHSHAQVRAGSLSRPRRPHGEETPAEDAQQKQHQLT